MQPKKFSRYKWILFPLALLGLVWAAAGGFFSPGQKTTLPGFREELQKLVAAHNVKDVYVKGHIQLFDGTDVQKIVEQKEMELIREERQVWSRLDVLESFLFDTLAIQVDHAEKQVVIRMMDREEQEQVWNQQLPLDELLSEDAVFRLTGEVLEAKGASRRLDIRNDLQPEIWKTLIEYDTSHYRVQKAEINWIKDERASAGSDNETSEQDCWVTRIVFSYPSKAGQSAAGKLSRILENGPQGWKLTGDCTSYQLINTTTYQP